MFKWITRVFLAALTVPAAIGPIVAKEQEPLVVFAASSMKNVLEDIVPLFEEQSGGKIVVSLAASSALARQIEAGAPADVFISADSVWMDYLAAAGLLVEDSRKIIAMNDLVVVGSVADSKPLNVNNTEEFLDTLGDARLAMADPDHVPAGRYAKAALETLELWPALKNRLVPADNVRVALTLVARGEVPLGIVYASDAQSDDSVSVLARIPAGSHPSIVYPAAVVRGGKRAQAERFIDFLTFHEPQVAFINAGFRAIE